MIRVGGGGRTQPTPEGHFAGCFGTDRKDMTDILDKIHKTGFNFDRRQIRTNILDDLVIDNTLLHVFGKEMSVSIVERKENRKEAVDGGFPFTDPCLKRTGVMVLQDGLNVLLRLVGNGNKGKLVAEGELLEEKIVLLEPLIIKLVDTLVKGGK